LGVVLAQRHDHELRQVAARLGGVEVFDPAFHAVFVAPAGPGSAVDRRDAVGALAVAAEADAVAAAEVPEIAGLGHLHVVVAGHGAPTRSGMTLSLATGARARVSGV